MTIFYKIPVSTIYDNNTGLIQYLVDVDVGVKAKFQTPNGIDLFNYMRRYTTGE
jgi:hypothetical protein